MLKNMVEYYYILILYFSMAYSENAQHLYVCASDGAIILWEIQNNRQDKSAFRVFSPKNFLMLPS